MQYDTRFRPGQGRNRPSWYGLSSVIPGQIGLVLFVEGLAAGVFEVVGLACHDPSSRLPMVVP
jgi:hypothetical protein